MENNYILYVGMESSKGKADAAILKVSDRRSVKPKFFDVISPFITFILLEY